MPDLTVKFRFDPSTCEGGFLFEPDVCPVTQADHRELEEFMADIARLVVRRPRLEEMNPAAAQKWFDGIKGSASSAFPEDMLLALRERYAEEVLESYLPNLASKMSDVLPRFPRDLVQKALTILVGGEELRLLARAGGFIIQREEDYTPELRECLVALGGNGIISDSWPEDYDYKTQGVAHTGPSDLGMFDGEEPAWGCRRVPDESSRPKDLLSGRPRRRRTLNIKPAEDVPFSLHDLRVLVRSLFLGPLEALAAASPTLIGNGAYVSDRLPPFPAPVEEREPVNFEDLRKHLGDKCPEDLEGVVDRLIEVVLTCEGIDPSDIIFFVSHYAAGEKVVEMMKVVDGRAVFYKKEVKPPDEMFYALPHDISLPLDVMNELVYVVFCSLVGDTPRPDRKAIT